MMTSGSQIARWTHIGGCQVVSSTHTQGTIKWPTMKMAK